MKLKKIIKVQLSILIALTTTLNLSAQSSTRFETQLVDYDIVANDYIGRGDEVIPNGSTLEPGQIFQLDVLLSEVGPFQIEGMELGIQFDKEVIEPVYVDDSGDILDLVIEPQNLLDRKLFPGSRRSTWSEAWDINADKNTILFTYYTNNQSFVIVRTKETLISSLFFKVKENATPGSEIRFHYSNRSSFGDLKEKNKNINDLGFVGEMAYATVAGETLEENNALKDIKIKGNTNAGTYDYLEFDENKTKYDLVVPPSVDSLSFSHELKDSASGTSVSHGKLDQKGHSVSGYKLDVGDNTFKTVVKDSKGGIVKEYDYTVKRLSNDVDYALSGIDNNNEAMVFEDRQSTVRSNADSVRLELSLKKDKKASFEFEVSSDETTVDNETVHILKNKTETPFKIKFWAEDALSRYDDVLGINDNRSEVVETDYKLLRASNDNSISKVDIKNNDTMSIIKTWNVSQDIYELEVSNDVKNIAIEIETKHDDAKIMTGSLDNIVLKPGDNEIKVKVNAPDGTEKDYIFRIKRIPRKIAELESLSIKVDGKEMNSPITSVKQSTNLELEFKDDYSVSIEGIAKTDLGALLKSGNVKDQKLKLGKNTFKLVVQAEDKVTEKTYTVNITVKENSKSDLEDELKPNPDIEEELVDPSKPIEDESLPDEKDPENESISIYRYTINVLNSKKSFSMDDLSIKIPQNAKVVGGEPIDLKVGDNTFTFDVVSQDKSSTSRYIITVNRAKNNKASVDAITVISDPQGTLTGNPEKGYTYRVAANVFEYEVRVEISDGSVVDETTVGPGFKLDESKVHIVKVTSEDGTDTKEYKIQIIREKSDDALLSSLVVSYGDVKDNDIISSFVNQRYTLHVESDVEMIEIIAKTNHPKASFVINNTNDTDFDLDYGENNFAIEVRSETGKMVQYTFKVNRAKSDNASLLELRVDGKLVDAWNPTVTDYEIGSVDEFTNKLNITYVCEDEHASVKIMGNELKPGKNVVEIIVTAQDGKTQKVYTIAVERDLSSSADIDEDDIKPNDPNHDIEATDDPYRYKVYVPYGTKTYGKDDFTLTLDEGAKVVYEKDFITLDPKGSNEFKFSITSPNGKNTKNYIIEVIIMDSSLPMLIDAFINGRSIEKFDPTIKETVVILDGLLDEKDTEFEFTVNAPVGVNVSYFDPMIKVTNKQVIEQKVVITRLSDGLTETYTFKFTRTLTSDDTLSDLDVSEGSLEPSFSENPNGPFEVKVDGDVEKIKVTPTPTNPNSSVKGDDEKELVPGKNIINITVEAEDKSSSKDYVVVIHRDIHLKELKLGDIDVDVDSGIRSGRTVSYVIDEKLPSDQVEAYLKAVANHPSVKITGEANKDIVLDNKDIKFTLTAQDKESKLDVIVKYQRALSTDARLKDLKTLNKDLVLEPKFESDLLEYHVNVSHDFKTLERDNHLKWETMHPNTKVSAIEKLDLDNTKVNKYEITTVAEDGVTKLTYVLNISRGTYNFLDTLRISPGEGHFETTFKPEVLEYEALVYSGVERFSFEWTHQEGVTVKNANELVNISSDVLPYEFTIEVAGDNGETNEYRVMVNKGVSTRLKNLATSEGKLDFSPDIYKYDVYVSVDTKTASLIDIETEDKNAKYSGNFENVALKEDHTAVEVKVENKGYSSTYVVNFIKIKDLTEIKTITANDGKNIWRSNLNDSGDFEIVVNHETKIEDLDIKVELKDPSGKYKISEPKILEDGSYQYIVSVTDKHGITKDYELIIKNDFSDNNFLETLNVNGSKVAGFNRYATDYDVHLKADDDFDIVATAEDPNASVDINIPKPLEDGSVVEITVTSEKGNARVYKVHITKESKNTALLDSLRLEEASFRPQFNPKVNSYFVTVPYELDAVTVFYETADNVEVELESNATIKGMKISNLVVGDNHIHFKLSAEDGSVNVYTIHILRGDVSDNYLLSLSVKDLEDNTPYEFNQKFTKEKLNYTVEVPYNKNSFKISGEASEGLRVYGLEDIVLQEFPYTHEVRVVDKQNIARIYSITFVKKASESPNLSDLWTNKGALSPVFEAHKTSYNIDVEYEVKDIEILYTKAHEDQIVEGAGVKDLKPGRNTFEIHVKSGEARQTYTIFVNRAYGSASLDWLETSVGTLDPAFDKNKTMYKVTVDHTVENLTINAGSNNEAIVVEGSGLKEVKEGTNIFEINVSNEFGIGNTYYVVVHKERAPDIIDDPYADDVSLAYLDLKNETLNETFSPEVFEYTANLSKSHYDDLEVIAIPRNPLATAEIMGNTDLGVGTHTITVRVSYNDKHQDTSIQVNVKQQYLISDIHTIGEKYIPTVKEAQTVLDLKNQMLNPNEVLKVFYNGVLLKDDETVGTGAIIKLVENEIEYDSKVIVILGDVNGDGLVTIADLMKTQSYILGNELSEVEKLAADVSQDGAIEINDFMMIQSHILKILDIHNKVEGKS